MRVHEELKSHLEEARAVEQEPEDEDEVDDFGSATDEKMDAGPEDLFEVGTVQPINQTALNAAKPDLFFEPSYTPQLRQMIEEIVRDQGPVHIDSVARQITTNHGWSKVGRKIRARVEECASGPDRTSEFSGLFLWSDRPERVVAWRPTAGRDAGEISVAEIAGLLEVKDWIVGAEDPVQALARELGLSALRVKRREELSNVFAAALERLSEI